MISLKKYFTPPPCAPIDPRTITKINAGAISSSSINSAKERPAVSTRPTTAKARSAGTLKQTAAALAAGGAAFLIPALAFASGGPAGIFTAAYSLFSQLGVLGYIAMGVGL